MSTKETVMEEDEEITPKHQMSTNHPTSQQFNSFEATNAQDKDIQTDQEFDGTHYPHNRDILLSDTQEDSFQKDQIVQTHPDVQLFTPIEGQDQNLDIIGSLGLRNNSIQTQEQPDVYRVPETLLQTPFHQYMDKEALYSGFRTFNNSSNISRTIQTTLASRNGVGTATMTTNQMKTKYQPKKSSFFKVKNNSIGQPFQIPRTASKTANNFYSPQPNQSEATHQQRQRPIIIQSNTQSPTNSVRQSVRPKNVSIKQTDFVSPKRNRQKMFNENVIYNQKVRVLSEEKKLAQMPPDAVDYNKFEFYQNDSSFHKLDEFKRSFLDFNQVNKQKISKQMIHILTQTAMSHLNEQFQDIPQFLKHNKMNWCQMLVKSNKMQKFFIHFTDQFQRVMNDEILNNTGNIDMYLKHPRNTTILDLDKYINQMNNHSTELETKMIENSIDDAKQKFNYKRERQQKLRKSVYGIKNEKVAKKQGIDEQLEVADKQRDIMKDLKANLKKKCVRKPVETQFQTEVKESAAKINELISSIDKNNDAFKCEIDLTEFQLTEMDQRRKRPDHSMIPGKKIQEMIEKWGQQDVIHPEDLQYYGEELWLTRAQFEKKLEKETKGHDLVFANLKELYEGRIQRIKEATSIQLDVLQTALTDAKFKYFQLREQMSMQQEDLDSKKMNEYKTVEELDDVVKECDKRLVIKNVADARVKIKMLVRLLKSNGAQIQDLEVELKEAQTLKASFQEGKLKYEKDYNIENELRQFYQRKLLKLLRDMDAYQDDEAQKLKFRVINENHTNLEDQKQYMETLKKLDCGQLLIKFVNDHYGFKEILDNVQDLVVAGQQTKNDSQRGSTKDVLGSPSKLSQIGMSSKSLNGFGFAAKVGIQNLITQYVNGQFTPKATETSGQPIDYEEIERQKKLKKKKGKKKQGNQKKQSNNNVKRLNPKVRKSISQHNNSSLSREIGNPDSVGLDSIISESDNESSPIGSPNQVNRKRSSTLDVQFKKPRIQLDRVSPVQLSSDLETPYGKREKEISRQITLDSNISNKDSISLDSNNDNHAKSQQKTKGQEKASLKVPKTDKKRQNSSRKKKGANKEVEVPDTQQSDNEEKPKIPICIIDNELNMLTEKKYKRLHREVDEYLLEDEKAFKMKAVEIAKCQDTVKHVLQTDLKFDDYQSMFQADVTDFVEAFNEVISKEYKFQEINKAIETGETAIKKSKKNSFDDLNIGHMLRPQFDEKGHFVGIQLRPDLAKIAYMQNEFDATTLRRMMKVCIYINRMVRDGKDDDFAIKQLADGELVDVPQTQFAEQQVCPKCNKTANEQQKDVDKPISVVSSIKSGSSSSDSSEQEDQQIGSIENHILLLVKNHAIDIMTRMNPNKRGYYQLIWENMDLEKICSYQLENVFKTRKDEQKDRLGQGISVLKYLEVLFNMNTKKIQEIGLTEEEKERFVLEEFIFKGRRPPEIITKNRSTQTKPPPKPVKKKDQEIQTVESKVPQTQKSIEEGHKRLAAALSQEYEITAGIFDTYVKQCKKLDEHQFRGNALDNMKLREELKQCQQLIRLHELDVPQPFDQKYQGDYQESIPTPDIKHHESIELTKIRRQMNDAKQILDKDIEFQKQPKVHLDYNPSPNVGKKTRVEPWKDNINLNQESFSSQANIQFSEHSPNRSDGMQQDQSLQLNQSQIQKQLDNASVVHLAQNLQQNIESKKPRARKKKNNKDNFDISAQILEKIDKKPLVLDSNFQSGQGMPVYVKQAVNLSQTTTHRKNQQIPKNFFSYNPLVDQDADYMYSRAPQIQSVRNNNSQMNRSQNLFSPRSPHIQKMDNAIENRNSFAFKTIELAKAKMRTLNNSVVMPSLKNKKAKKQKILIDKLNIESGTFIGNMHNLGESTNMLEESNKIKSQMFNSNATSNSLFNASSVPTSIAKHLKSGKHVIDDRFKVNVLSTDPVLRKIDEEIIHQKRGSDVQKKVHVRTQGQVSMKNSLQVSPSRTREQSGPKSKNYLSIIPPNRQESNVSRKPTQKDSKHNSEIEAWETGPIYSPLKPHFNKSSLRIPREDEVNRQSMMSSQVTDQNDIAE